MKLYEYMGKELFAKYGIRVPRGRVVASAEEAETAAAELGPPVVLKAQVLVGGRGKAGAVRFADSPKEARAAAAEMLGREIKGCRVERVLIEEKLQIDRELYLSVAVDGGARRPVLLASAHGGVDIEEVPEDRLVRYHVDPTIGVLPYVGREITRRLGLTGNVAREVQRIIPTMYRIFCEKDAELVEINPLVVCGEEVLAADAKVTVDDEALFRQKDLPFVEERTEIERRAHELGLSYVELDGNISVMANGAGMTMATLDLIQAYGGRPANFLDAGGGTGEEATAQALELLLATGPRAIFINIFGGITRCDDVARAFVRVKESREIPVPVVIRLVGTNEEQALAILRAAGIEAFRNMEEAARKAVELAGGEG